VVLSPGVVVPHEVSGSSEWYCRQGRRRLKTEGSLFVIKTPVSCENGSVESLS
jgi:hypothetical protein